MVNENQSNIEKADEKPLFILIDKAYIFTRIWSLFFAVASMLGIYLLFGRFDSLIEYNQKVIIGYVLFIYIITTELIKLIIVLYKKNKRVKFYKNKIITTYNPREIFINKISNIDKFRVLVQYDGRRRLRYKGFSKLLINISVVGLLIIFISNPKIIIVVLYYIFFYYLSITVYSLIINKNTQVLNINMIDIKENQTMITLLLDNSNDTRKIKEYFKNYKNIDLSNISKKIIFRD